MIAVRTIQWIAGIAGLIALVLGILFWITGADVITIHRFLGFIVAVALLILGIVGVSTPGLRVLGVIAIIYAPVLPIFGLNQELLLIGNLHWLIQLAHMLVGIGALALMGIIATRYARIKQTAAKAVVTEAGR